MSDQENNINVDLNRVVEKLKISFTNEVANLKHQLAMYEVALEDAVNDRDAAREQVKQLTSTTPTLNSVPPLTGEATHRPQKAGRSSLSS